MSDATGILASDADKRAGGQDAAETAKMRATRVPADYLAVTAGWQPGTPVHW
jgi:hypothetical protein